MSDRRRRKRSSWRSCAASVSLALLLLSLLPIILMHRYVVLYEAAHQHPQQRQDPIPIPEIIEFLSDWIHKLHVNLRAQVQQQAKGEKSLHPHLLWWNTYHDMVVKELLPWDDEYLQHHMPERRTDGSIFLSVASYRDENCPTTLSEAFAKAKDPTKLFVGLVQQNCLENCESGVLENYKREKVDPDPDCYQVFCDTHPQYCAQIRAIHLSDTESLGPYGARYFGSKLWNGESWYMQIDAHMTFLQDWDAISIDMLHRAPSQKPILSHYPPGHKMDLVDQSTKPAGRLCGPVFATSSKEAQIIRLEGLAKWDKKKLDIPRFAPFAAAGYFVAHPGFLKEVPFDPFLPWIFMGEEIILSTRLWTSGYDIFSPAQAVVGHIYRRPHKPKFWESVNRAFGTGGAQDSLEGLVLQRIKYQLGYPEAARDMLPTRSILTALDRYSMGTERPLEEYLRSAGIDVTRKEITITDWCEKGRVPPGKEEYAHLYEYDEEKRD